MLNLGCRNTTSEILPAAGWQTSLKETRIERIAWSDECFWNISLQHPVSISHFVIGNKYVGRLVKIRSMPVPVSVVELYLVGSPGSTSVSCSSRSWSFPLPVQGAFLASVIATGTGSEKEYALPMVDAMLKSPDRTRFELIGSIAHKSMSFLMLLQIATLSPATLSPPSKNRKKWAHYCPNRIHVRSILRNQSEKCCFCAHS